jgi:hypothetical protein
MQSVLGQATRERFQPLRQRWMSFVKVGRQARTIDKSARAMLPNIAPRGTSYVLAVICPG